jgi:hypothetical protein
MRLLKLLLAGALVWVGIHFFFGVAFRLFTFALELLALGAIAVAVVWLVRGGGRRRELRRASRVLGASARYTLPARRRARLR